ncbi:Maestro heat-like repeat-containing protein family member 2A [Sciurus carolinensis]|uniref:Maestro heat-like repeat-containing protein family member 2A n=1 Tax=Sciurus carolinensis TaxID=30640 RepID=A0AA41SVM5_SCICA|nr:Maestro heat-like repeat-containing protein family member 2A [Sciurus carolinensis]
MNMSIHSVISLQHPGEDNESIKTLYENMLKSLEHLMEGLMQRQIDPCGLQEMVYAAEILDAILVYLPMVDHLEVWHLLIEGIILCTIHLLLEKLDRDDKLRDLFPGFIYTLLLQVVKQYQKLLLKQYLGFLWGPVSSTVTAEVMEALIKVLTELQEGNMCWSFEAISELCRVSFDNACMATMFQCVHFWGWKSLEGPSGQSDTRVNEVMTIFQTIVLHPGEEAAGDTPPWPSLSRPCAVLPDMKCPMESLQTTCLL